MTDLISRQAAIEHLKKRLYETALNNDTEHPYYEEMAVNRVSVWLEEVPTIEPKHGKWKIIKGVLHPLEIDGVCSICDYATGNYHFYNYCPNCGARMSNECAD